MMMAMVVRGGLAQHSDNDDIDDYVDGMDVSDTGTRAALNPAVADSQQRRRRKLKTPTTN